jgi:hypothetical protein
VALVLEQRFLAELPVEEVRADLKEDKENDPDGMQPGTKFPFLHDLHRYYKVDRDMNKAQQNIGKLVLGHKTDMKGLLTFLVYETYQVLRSINKLVALIFCRVLDDLDVWLELAVVKQALRLLRFPLKVVRPLQLLARIAFVLAG